MKSLMRNLLLLVFIGIYVFLFMIIVHKLDEYGYMSYFLSRYVTDGKSQQLYFTSYQLLNNFHQLSFVIFILMFSEIWFTWRSYKIYPKTFPKIKEVQKTIVLVHYFFLSLLIIGFIAINYFKLPSNMDLLITIVLFLPIQLIYQISELRIKERVMSFQQNSENVTMDEKSLSKRKQSFVFKTVFSIGLVIVVGLLTLSTIKISHPLSLGFPNKLVMTENITYYNDYSMSYKPYFGENDFYLDREYDYFFNHYELSEIKLEINDPSLSQSFINGEDTIILTYYSNEYIIDKSNLSYANNELTIHFDQIKKVKPKDDRFIFYLEYKHDNDDLNDLPIKMEQFILLKK